MATEQTASVVSRSLKYHLHVELSPEGSLMPEEKQKYDRFILRQGKDDVINIYGVRLPPEDIVEYLGTWDHKAQIETHHFLAVVLYGVGRDNKDTTPK